MMMKKEEKSQKQPKRYWLVNITLTSGSVLEFYVSARNQFDAQEKADAYAELAQDEKLMKIYGKSFRLIP